MGIALTLPTPLDTGTNNVWGTTVNTALTALTDADVFKEKSANESVTSSTVLQDDDHLAAMTLGVGTWVVDVGFHVTGGSGGFKAAWVFSGTLTRSLRIVSGTDASAVYRLLQVVLTTGSSMASSAAGSNQTGVQETHTLVVSGSGTFKLQWAQVASNATPTVLNAGSYVHARRMS